LAVASRRRYRIRLGRIGRLLAVQPS